MLREVLVGLVAVASAETPIDSTPCVGAATFLGLPRTTVQTSRDYTNRLTLCRRHDSNTCCTPDMAEALRLRLRPTAKRQISQTLYGLEANAQGHWQRGLSVGCQLATEEALCSVCDALAGRSAAIFAKSNKELRETRPDKMVPICQDTCRSWYQNCLDSLFVIDPKDQRLVPCQGDGPLVCWKARHIENSTSFCSGFGLAVVNEGFGSGSDTESGYCYDGTVLGAKILGKGPQPEPTKRRVSVHERLLLFSDLILESFEYVWRRMSGMLIWLIIFGILWYVSHTNRLRVGPDQYIENPGWAD